MINLFLVLHYVTKMKTANLITPSLYVLNRVLDSTRITEQDKYKVPVRKQYLDWLRN